MRAFVKFNYVPKIVLLLLFVLIVSLFVKGDEDKIITNFLSEIIKISAVSEEELKNFHYSIATPFLTT